MSRWELIETAAVPGGAELRLYRRGDEHAIRVPGLGELMNSRTHGSEDALATLTCERLGAQPGRRVLIGGLGMGFTLAAALAQLGPDAQVVVAELVPAVIDWNRGALGAHAGAPLTDRRVHVHTGDVRTLIDTPSERFHGIALDVDNGPEGLARRANDWLYSLDGLLAAYQALEPDGALTVWSAGPDATFTRRLRKVGFRVEEHRVHAHGKKGSRHLIWRATRPADR